MALLAICNFFFSLGWFPAALQAVSDVGMVAWIPIDSDYLLET